jgi:hypothetical protein
MYRAEKIPKENVNFDSVVFEIQNNQFCDG